MKWSTRLESGFLYCLSSGLCLCCSYIYKNQTNLNRYILEFQKFIISSKFHSQQNHIPLTLPIHQPCGVRGHRSTVHGPRPFLKFQSCLAKGSSNPEEQLNEIKDGYWITNIGSGKVAGKVLIVDHIY